MDPGSSYTRFSSVSRTTELVAITAINVGTNPPRATAMTRSREYMDIEISYHVGAVRVTPSVGEQWLVVKDRGIWKLESQLPFNVPSTLIRPVEGEVRLGGRGPTELDGSQVNINAPMRVMATTTDQRPSASSFPAGTNIFDTTINKPLWSDGTQWRDAAGSVA